MGNRSNNYRLSKLKQQIKKPVVRRKDGYYRKSKNGRRTRVRSHNQTYYKRLGLSDVVAQRERIQYYTDQMLRADELYRENLKLLLSMVRERSNIQNDSNSKYITDEAARANKVEIISSRINDLETIQSQHLSRFISFAETLQNVQVDPEVILLTYARIPNLLQDGVGEYLDLQKEFDEIDQGDSIA